MSNPIQLIDWVNEWMNKWIFFILEKLKWFFAANDDNDNIDGWLHFDHSKYEVINDSFLSWSNGKESLIPTSQL